jgi:hypothetical protein
MSRKHSINFNEIESNAFWILNKLDEDNAYYEAYLNYLEDKGWTDQEFDRELLIKIDNNWLPSNLN